MSLRTRLVVTLLALSLPLVAGAVWLQGRLDDRAESEELAKIVRTALETGREAAESDPTRWPPLPGGLRGGEPRGRDERPPRGADRLPPLREGPPREGPPRDGPPGEGPLGDGPQGLASRRPEPSGSDESRVVPFHLFAYDSTFRSANSRAIEFPTRLRTQLEAGALQATEKRAWQGHDYRFAAVRMDWDTGPCTIALGWRPLPPSRLSANQVATAASVALGLIATVFLAAGPLVARLRRLRDEVRASSESGYTAGISVQGNDEIAQLAGEFDRAAREVRVRLDEVRDRERALRDFVSDTTHDVMIPMTVLQGHLADLRRSGTDGASLGDAIGEVQYVTSLLRNLSTTAKLAAGEFEPDLRPVDLGELVQRVVARFTPLARERGIELNHGVPEAGTSVRGDVTLLEQAVGNLVHNAVRYGRSGGHAAVLLTGTDPGFELRVIDDGPGIPESRIAELSARASRSDEARSRHPEGQGLGLSIAFQVAARHGFELSLGESPEGGLEAILRG